MVNTLIEYNFQDALKNGVSSENGAYMQKGTVLRMIMACRPEVTF
jgi:hypothetical protein